jgi:hypothetical protein
MKVRIKDFPLSSPLSQAMTMGRPLGNRQRLVIPTVTSDDNAEAIGESAKAIDTLREMAPTTRSMFDTWIVQLDDICKHYVKTSNRSRSICNGPLTPVTSTHICNGCCLAPVTYKRARTTPGLASTMPVTNVDFW